MHEKTVRGAIGARLEEEEEEEEEEAMKLALRYSQ